MDTLGILKDIGKYALAAILLGSAFALLLALVL